MLRAATIYTKEGIRFFEDMRGANCGGWPATHPHRNSAPLAKTNSWSFGTFTPNGEDMEGGQEQPTIIYPCLFCHRAENDITAF